MGITRIVPYRDQSFDNPLSGRLETVCDMRSYSGNTCSQSVWDQCCGLTGTNGCWGRNRSAQQLDYPVVNAD